MGAVCVLYHRTVTLIRAVPPGRARWPSGEMVVFEAWSFNTTHRLCQHNTQTIWKSTGSSLVAKLCHWKKPWPKGHDNCRVCSMATLVCFTNLHFCFWYFYSANFDFLSVEWLINCKNKLFWMFERQLVLVIDLDWRFWYLFSITPIPYKPKCQETFFFFFLKPAAEKLSCTLKCFSVYVFILISPCELIPSQWR